MFAFKMLELTLGPYVGSRKVGNVCSQRLQPGRVFFPL